jgi:hypothetical protein
MPLKEKTIIEIAEDRIVAKICEKYYYETDPVIKQQLFDEIQRWYEKINNK